MWCKVETCVITQEKWGGSRGFWEALIFFSGGYINNKGGDYMSWVLKDTSIWTMVRKRNSWKDRAECQVGSRDSQWTRTALGLKQGCESQYRKTWLTKFFFLLTLLLMPRDKWLFTCGEICTPWIIIAVFYFLSKTSFQFLYCTLSKPDFFFIAVWVCLTLSHCPEFSGLFLQLFHQLRLFIISGGKFLFLHLWIWKFTLDKYNFLASGVTITWNE